MANGCIKKLKKNTHTRRPNENGDKTSAKGSTGSLSDGLEKQTKAIDVARLRPRSNNSGKQKETTTTTTKTTKTTTTTTTTATRKESGKNKIGLWTFGSLRAASQRCHSLFMTSNDNTKTKP